MKAKSLIRITGDIMQTFDTRVEEEKRFEIPVDDFKKAIFNRVITMYKAIEIEQVWFGHGPNYNARIRQTRIRYNHKIPSTMTSNDADIMNFLWEHTVKHHITKTADYEITTELTKEDYNLLKKIYKEEKVQTKVRFYLKQNNGENEDYIITADFPTDNPDICWIEFETKPEITEPQKFKKPEWIKVNPKDDK